MGYLLVLVGLMLANVAQAIDCQKVPDCTELGYSQTENENCAEGGYIYCPFDKSYKKCVNMDCEALGFTKEDKTSWCGKIVSCRADKRFTACKALCEIGDIYYSNGTCGYLQDYDSTNKNKIPVGVVFYVTDEGRHGKVISLKSAKSLVLHTYNPSNVGTTHNIMPFGLVKSSFYTHREDVVTQYKQKDPALFNGKENTRKIVQDPLSSSCSESYTPGSREHEIYCQATAALRCLAYVPEKVDSSNPLVGAGQWYLPSIGEMMQLWGTDPNINTYLTQDENGPGEIFKIVNKTIRALPHDNLEGNEDIYQWTSTPEGTYDAYTFNFTKGARALDGFQYGHNVRPMLEF